MRRLLEQAKRLESREMHVLSIVRRRNVWVNYHLFLNLDDTNYSSRFKVEI